MAPRAKSDNSGLPARRAALHLLRGVLEERLQISDLLGPQGPLYGLSAPDRARAQRLSLTVLRHLSRADHLLEQHIERLPPLGALNILRLAVVELCEEKTSPHGVVDSAVTLMRKNRKASRMAGMANAVLRKIANDGPEMWPDLPPSTLPKWLRRRIVHIFDEETVQAIEAAHQHGAPLDITVKSEAELWAERLGGDLLPTGSIRITRSVQVTELEGYAEGAWWVQDAAAALPARLLGDIAGLKVLDLCAAPGGKTMQLVAMGAEVTALDQSGERMKRVVENLTRTQLTANCITADALEWTPDTQFDAVLLDAPCSATGTIRRHPDLPFVKTGKELDKLFALQSSLIDRAVSFLKPGGKLVYCTCSLLTEEGERQAKLAVERHGLGPISTKTETLGINADWELPSGGLRLRPDHWSARGGLDGFFMIALEKPQ